MEKIPTEENPHEDLTILSKEELEEKLKGYRVRKIQQEGFSFTPEERADEMTGYDIALTNTKNAIKAVEEELVTRNEERSS